MHTYATYTYIHFDLIWCGGYVQDLHVEKEYTCIETEREKKTRKENENESRLGVA